MKALIFKNVSGSLLGLLLTIAALTTGCAPFSPRWDARFGEAVEIAKAQQTMNPEASLNTEPVQGVDGQAGDAMFDSYRNSFRTPQLLPRGIPSSLSSGGNGSNQVR
jgi:hypothetical protein